MAAGVAVGALQGKPGQNIALGRTGTVGTGYLNALVDDVFVMSPGIEPAPAPLLILESVEATVLNVVWARPLAATDFKVHPRQRLSRTSVLF